MQVQPPRIAPRRGILFRIVLGFAIFPALILVIATINGGFQSPLWHGDVRAASRTLTAVNVTVTLLTLTIGAYVSLGRYMVLKDAMSWWVCHGFTIFIVSILFRGLSFPLQAGGRGIVAKSPNSAAWIVMMGSLMLEASLIIAATTKKPGPQENISWVLTRQVLIASAIYFGLAIYGDSLPRLVDNDGRFTRLQIGWLSLNALSFLAGAYISGQRYIKRRDHRAAFSAIAQIVLFYSHVANALGGSRFSRAAMAAALLIPIGCVTIVFGLLSDYMAVLRRERRFNEQLIKRNLERAQTQARILELNRELDRRGQNLEAALREKSLLLKEVQHRVKNNLQVIASIASLQAREASPQASHAMLALRNRVKSMALVHEGLCFQGSLGNIDFGKYVEQLASRLIHSMAPEGVTIFLASDLKAVLPLDEAAPCGLIANELLSNSIEHAFHGRKSGVVSIRSWLEESNLTIEFRDDGNGMPAGFTPGTASSLGLQLADDLAAQLHGSLSWRNEGGSVFVLQFPSRGGLLNGASRTMLEGALV